MLISDAGKVLATGSQVQLQKKSPKATLVDLGGKTLAKAEKKAKKQS
jgi:hypothetical protein